jgi:predicted metal-dependent peptidase
MASARSYVRTWAPYMMPTLYAFVPVAVEGLTEKVGGPLAVTDRLVLLYEPEWVASVDAWTLATGLAHEVCHDQLRHISRGKSYPNKRLFNLAGDLFINGMLQSQMRRATINGSSTTAPMWQVPSWAVVPATYGFPEGLSADAYYKLLEQKGEPKEPQAWKIMCGGCGGVAGNPVKEFEQQFNVEKGRSEADCKNIARATSRLLKEYMEGPGRGTAPGNWSEFFDIGEESFPIPWRTKLANVLRNGINQMRAGGQDYSLRRPSARSYLRGWPLPGLISYDPEILFIVDSSGSMGKPQIGDTLRVIADIMDQCGIREAWFMEADAGVQRAPIKITSRMLRKMEISGRGGTDFTPAIEYAQKFKPRPGLVVYITDGAGVAPRTPPKEFNFMWCVVPSPWGCRPANWGTLVVLDDTAELRPAI